MSNKLGNYISSLMTVILDSNQDQFVKDLALGELRWLRRSHKTNKKSIGVNIW